MKPKFYHVKDSAGKTVGRLMLQPDDTGYLVMVGTISATMVSLKTQGDRWENGPPDQKCIVRNTEGD